MNEKGYRLTQTYSLTVDVGTHGRTWSFPLGSFRVYSIGP